MIFFPTFIIVFWPFLWLGVLDNLIFYFQNIPKMPVLSFYLGDYIYPQNTPWHYNLVWILITSPITVIIFFVIGFFGIFLRNIKRLFKIDNNRVTQKNLCLPPKQKKGIILEGTNEATSGELVRLLRIEKII